MKTYKDWICRYYSEHEDGEPDGEIIQELIRCRDCKWYYRGGATCMYWDGANSDDDFCSRAERAERKEE